MLAEEGEEAPVWDKSFFHQRCPGQPFTQPIPKDVGASADVQADDIRRLSDQAMAFVGNVLLSHSSRRLTADAATLTAEEVFKADGNVRYEDKQIKVTADSINIDLAKGEGEIKALQFQLQQGNIRGEADTLTLKESGDLSMTEAGFSSCPPEEESWKLTASRIDVDESEGWGDAEDVTLRIGDIPVLYFPTMSFPIDDRRKTGFLYPKIGRSERLGLEIEAPWYWNIAPDMDATITPRYLSDRGLMLMGEYRALTEHTENRVYAEWLGNDDEGLPGEEDRFLYQVESDYTPDDFWRGELSVSSVSDDDYFYDFGGSFESGNRNLVRRMGSMRYDDEHIAFRGLFTNDKLLNTPEDPYSRLPELSLDLFFPDELYSLSSKISVEATAFRHDNLADAERISVVPEVSYPMSWAAGYLTPTLKYHHTEYRQDDPLGILNEQETRSMPIFSLDGALFFERDLDIAEKSMTQTLEPRLFYVNIPERKQNAIGLYDTSVLTGGLDSLFRENRYTGIDRIGDTNQLTLAVTTRFFDNASGEQQLALTMGRAYYFEDRAVNLAVYPHSQIPVDLGVDTRDNSALITQLEWDVFEDWSFRGELEYDSQESKTEKGALGFYYKADDWVFNVRHRVHRFETAEAIEQAEFSMQLPITEQLYFVSRWQKDINNDRTIDQFAGLEYESCCWAMRLVARKYLNVRLDRQGIPVPGADDFNSGIYLEFILKGLTNIGKSLNLEEDIQGYEDRFKY